MIYHNQLNKNSGKFKVPQLRINKEIKNSITDQIYKKLPN